MENPAILDPSLAADLGTVLAGHGLNAADIDYCLKRFGPIVGVRLVGQQLGRVLKKKERQSAYVRLQEGESVESVVRHLEGRA